MAASDIRGMGCPDAIFQMFVERRAQKLGIRKSSELITDDERRAQSARTAALIQADNDRHDQYVSLYNDGI
jgi:hypothetical protein